MLERLIDLFAAGVAGVMFLIFVMTSVWAAWMYVVSDIGPQAGKKTQVLWWYGGGVIATAIGLAVLMIFGGIGRWLLEF